MNWHPRAVAAGLVLLALGAGATIGSTRATTPLVPAASGLDVASLSNDEVVVATLDSSGLPQKARLISRVTSNGGPVREVADPSSVTNVRYLDRLGRPRTEHNNVLVQVGGPGVRTVLTEARFDQPLPVALHAQYKLGGKAVAPSNVLGSGARVTISYTVTNTTATTATLRYVDAAGSRRTAKQPVFAPFTGTLIVTLPKDAEVVSAPRAVRMADANGETQLQWNLVLYPPLTSPRQVAQLVVRSPRSGLPSVSVRLSPAGSTADPTAKFALALLAGGEEGNTQLYEGLRELDRGAGSLAAGSAGLSTGLSTLADGAVQAASGSDKLASGMTRLAAGAGKLATGNQKLATALGKAADGARRLSAASRQLADADTSASLSALASLHQAAAQLTDGASTLASRLGRASDPPLPDPLPSPDDDSVCDLDSNNDGKPDKQYDDDCVTIYQGLRGLAKGLHSAALASAALVSNLESASVAAAEVRSGIVSAGEQSGAAAQGAAALAGELCAPGDPQLSSEQCASLGGIAASAAGAAQTAAATGTPLTELLTALGTAQAYGAALSQGIDDSAAAADRLLAGLDALGAGLSSTDASKPGLVEGLNALTVGLAQLATGLQAGNDQLAGALSGLAEGNAGLAAAMSQAATGGGSLAAGAGQLATGGQRVAESAQQLAAGISGLATGADQASAGVSELASGAQALQEQGTSRMADSLVTASREPALMRAWLSAAGDRAADALPYGPPKGAVGHVVYLLEFPGQQAPPGSLWDRVAQWFRD